MIERRVLTDEAFFRNAEKAMREARKKELLKQIVKMTKK